MARRAAVYPTWRLANSSSRLLQPIANTTMSSMLPSVGAMPRKSSASRTLCENSLSPAGEACPWPSMAMFSSGSSTESPTPSASPATDSASSVKNVCQG